ncbi:metal ABC transporter ATP-binding protein [bacterium]|nr:metal ABC transporter ATP-binding protein [bacterium]
MTNRTLIEFKNTILGYGGKAVLSNLNFGIFKDDFVGIVGPNGAGKTTILKGILGILKPLKGEINFSQGRNKQRMRFGYVPQIQTIDEIFPLTVYEIIMMGRYSEMSLLSKPGRTDKEKVVSALKYTGIEKLADKLYRELSGGLRQRVLLARALAGDPDMLILDEPTNDLDLAGEKAIMDLIKKLNNEQNITVVMVSHLLNVVINYVKKLAFLDKEKFHMCDIEEAFTEKNLTDIYNTGVKIADLEGKRIAIAG